MSGVHAWVALAGALLALGCRASLDGDAGPAPGASGSGAGAAGSGNAVGGSPSVAGAQSRDTAAQRCETTQLSPPQLRRLTSGELERSLRDIFPSLASGWAGVRVGADPVSSLGFSNDARSLVVASQTAQELLGTAEDVASSLVNGGALAAFAPCATEAAPGRACADQLVRAVGARLFRRAVSAEESADYGALFDNVAAKSDFVSGARWVLVALIQSPNAVYRSELGSGGGARQLTSDEIASELAYTFGGTTPSVELLAAAARGDFVSAEARVAKARELLSTPTGREQLHQFLAEWSGYGRVASRTKTTLAGFDLLRDAMLQETRQFLEEAVVTRKGGVRELLTGGYTFVDSGLAQLYGFGAGAGSGFARTERPARRGIGLLAQGAILAGAAHADASSPTLRGLVVYERLLCHQRQKPPPNIPTIEAPMPGAKTTRERYEVSHGGKPGCSACHQNFDPIGFAFEHYDEAGRYRADENGLPIDSTGSVLAKDRSVAFSFDGIEELSQQLAARAEVADCVSGLAAAYAFAGAGGRTCLAEEARAAFGRGEVGVLDFFASLAAAPSFTTRAP